MSVDVPDNIPSTFSAGETVKFRRFVPDYLPSDGWKYSVYLNGALATLTKDGVADGDAYLVTILPTDSLPTGDYRFLERVSKFDTDGTTLLEAHNVGDGVVFVALDLATASAGACISHTERMVALLEAALEEKIPADLQSYSIGGRIVSKIPLPEVKKLLGEYRVKLWQMRNPGRLAPSVEVVFSPLEDTHSLPSTWVDITGIPE